MTIKHSGKILLTGAIAAATVALSAGYLDSPAAPGERLAEADRWASRIPAASTLAFDSSAKQLVLTQQAAAHAATPASSPSGSTPTFALEVEAEGQVTVRQDVVTGGTSMARVAAGGDLYPQANGLPPVEKINAFLDRHGAVFGISDAPNQLRMIAMDVDQYGNSHVSYQQMHGDVPVLGGVMRGHVSKDGRLTAVNGKYIPDVNLPQTAAIDRAAAAKTATRVVASQLPSMLKGAKLETGSTRLYVYRQFLTRGTPGNNHLAYEIEVRHGGSVREFVYVDAQDGKVIDQVSGIHGVKNRRVYEGTYDPASPNLPPPAWKEGDLRPALDPFHEDEVAGAGESYNLFFNLSGGTFRSWDGNDAPMITVNNDPTIVCPNAQWNGTSTNYCTGTSADDVVTHEWTHAYTQETSGLIYAWQSGALNESYSDVFGETVDLINNREFIAGAASNPQGNSGPRGSLNACSDFDSQTPEDDQSYRWLLGEDAFLFAALPPVGDAAIRDLWNPACFGDPGHVDSVNYSCSAGDAGGVHTNSAVNNRAYALLVDGGTIEEKDDGSDFAAPVTVTGIGLTKAAHIFWRANSVYNGPASNFADNADALEMACSDLVGQNLTKLVTDAENGTGLNPGHVGENNDTIDPVPQLSGEIITPADCDQIANAIAAVEMRFDVTKKCGFRSMLDPAPAPMCGNAETHTYFSEGWEGGFPASWSTGQQGVSKAVLDTREWFLRSGDAPNNPDGSAHSGNVMYQENRRDLGNCSTDDESGHLWMESPVITVDGTADSQMMFEHYVNTEVNYDGGNVMISINGGAFEVIPASAFVHNPYNGSLSTAADQNTNPKEGQEAWNGGNAGEVAGDWGQSQIDLAAAGVSPGDQIRLRWDLGQDGCNGSDGWYVDEIQLFTCGAVVNPPTGQCNVYPAEGFLPVVGSPIVSLVGSSTAAMVSGESELITDVNIVNLTGSHTYMGDLTFELTSPGNTTITLFDGSACGADPGIDINFDDDAATVAACGDWVSGGTFRPFQALTAFDGEDANGDWVLDVTDAFPLDEGQIDSWAVEVCTPIDDGDNLPPVAMDDSAETANNEALTIYVLENDDDPDGDNELLTVIAVTQPTNGEAVISDSGTTVTYLSDGSYVGTDTFLYTIEDEQGATDTAAVSVTVTEGDPDGEGGDEAKGSGKLNALPLGDDDDSSYDDSPEIDFHFDPKRKSGSEIKGHLHLKDKAADVKIHMKDITSLGQVVGSCGMINNGEGTYVVEFRGFGKFEQGDTKVENAEFRACAVDADMLDEKGKTEKSKDGESMDRFHLECLSGCSYNTDDRIDTDDVIDKGNIRIKLEDDDAGSAATPASSDSGSSGASESASTSDGSASTVFLEPALMSESTVGAVELFKVDVYDSDFRPLVGRSVTLTQTGANGGLQTLNAVTGPTGTALFNIAISPSASDFDASVDGVSSNGVQIRPLLP